MNSPLILLVIPQKQFCSQQLFDLKELLIKKKGQCRILSKSGKEAKGEGKSSIQPDGMLVDWNRYLEGRQKYDAVIVIGGKGSKTSIWENKYINFTFLFLYFTLIIFYRKNHRTLIIKSIIQCFIFRFFSTCFVLNCLEYIFRVTDHLIPQNCYICYNQKCADYTYNNTRCRSQYSKKVIFHNCV